MDLRDLWEDSLRPHRCRPALPLPWGGAGRGKVQRASGVIHLIVESVSDLTTDLQKVSGLDATFPLVAGRRDEAHHGGGSVSREDKPLQTEPRDIYAPDLHIGTLKLQ
jgi:hypothetical protein